MLGFINPPHAHHILTSIFTYPDIFRWAPDFTISGSGVGGYTTSYNPTNDKPTGTIVWVDSVNGNNANDGSEGSPYKSLQTAYNSGATVINIKAGDYFTGDMFNSALEFSRDIALVAVDGKGTVTMGHAEKGLTWVSAGSDTYSTTISGSMSGAGVVVDRTSGDDTYKLMDGVNPVPTPLEEVADLAAVQAHAGGAWALSGTTLYVKTHDLRTPDTDIVPMNDYFGIRISNQNIVVYMEGIEVWGRNPMTFANNGTSYSDAKFIAVDCGFRYCKYAANILIDTIYDVRMIRCATSHSQQSDGFNYAQSYSGQCNILEVDCVGFDCGDNASDQISTAHDACNIIRLNGIYDNGYAASILDIEDVHALNLGCIAKNSPQGFAIDAVATENHMWLKDCQAVNCADAVYVGAGSTYTDLGGNDLTDI